MQFNHNIQSFPLDSFPESDLYLPPGSLPDACIQFGPLLLNFFTPRIIGIDEPEAGDVRPAVTEVVDIQLVHRLEYSNDRTYGMIGIAWNHAMDKWR